MGEVEGVPEGLEEGPLMGDEGGEVGAFEKVEAMELGLVLWGRGLGLLLERDRKERGRG